MKTAVVGSRTITDYTTVKNILKQYVITQIVSGGANGVDKLAEYYSFDVGIENTPQIFYPDWKKFGRRAGFVRNTEIVDYADVVIAIWDGKSKGTQHSIDYAKKKGKVVHVHQIEISA